MTPRIPPVSRTALMLVVAAAAILSIVTSGKLSSFSAGIAIGAGIAFLLSRVRAAGETGPPPEGEP
jgi:hypothetical protein